MKLLVTGGAGYIGSIVARLLIADGHEVVVLDNLERGHREAVPPQAQLIVGDLRNPRGPRGALRAGGFDGVLHFAALALVGESVEHPERYYRTNVTGTLNLLEAMVAHDVPRLVFSSTCAVYGQPDEVPIPETRAAAAAERLRRLEARRRPPDRRLLRRPRDRRGQPALLQRRRRAR